MIKRDLVIAITFIAGAVILVDFFLDIPSVGSTAQTFLTWSVILAAFTTALGGANLLRVHARKIAQRQGEWWLSALLCAVLIGTVVLGIATTTSSDAYRFVWDNVLQPFSAMVFALNAFFIASAAYRSFRIRNIDATLMVIPALLVMLGRVGIGEVMYYRFPAIADWIMRIPNTAGMRGITIGAALGAITISCRILVGLERGHFGMKE